jgi:hypothetical protein
MSGLLMVLGLSLNALSMVCMVYWKIDMENKKKMNIPFLCTCIGILVVGMILLFTGAIQMGMTL